MVPFVFERACKKLCNKRVNRVGIEKRRRGEGRGRKDMRTGEHGQIVGRYMLRMDIQVNFLQLGWSLQYEDTKISIFVMLSLVWLNR